MGWFTRLTLGKEADGPELEQEAAKLREEEAEKDAKRRNEEGKK